MHTILHCVGVELSIYGALIAQNLERTCICRIKRRTTFDMRSDEETLNIRCYMHSDIGSSPIPVNHYQLKLMLMMHNLA